MLVDCPTCEHYETCEQEDRWYSVACINYKALPTKNPTNADRLRALSDEELAKMISGFESFALVCGGAWPPESWLNWLRQEATS